MELRRNATFIARSDQEQAVAAWVGYLNQLRIDRLLQEVHQHAKDLEEATRAIDDALGKIDVEIIGRNRGGMRGQHGFIAEVAETGVENARRLVEGDRPNLEWVNDNGPTDLRRHLDGGRTIDIQQKFVNAGGRYSLGAVEDHLHKYPDYVANGGRYQIPADHYQMVKKLYEMPREQAARLSRSGDGPSPRDWERVQRFAKETGLTLDDLEPAELRYGDVQTGTIHATLDNEEKSLRETTRQRDQAALQDSLPSLREGAKATAASAAIEGATSLATAISAKLREGRRVRDLDAGDWVDIAAQSGTGAVRGDARGMSVYVLTNYTATSAAVASSLVTAAFGVAEQAHRLRAGEIDEAEFVESAEMVCLDSAVSALSSFVGQALVPIPVLGAVLGNTVGMIMYQAARQGLSVGEQEAISAYTEAQRAQDAALDESHRRCVALVEKGMEEYLSLLEGAFAPDPASALEGSVALAQRLGVASEKILDTREKARAFFED